MPCGLCQEPVCKDCETFIEPSSFSFLKKTPEVLTHTHYCQSCYENSAKAALDAYNETMERAHDIYFFFNTQKRPPPIIKKARLSETVENCGDRDETILRLAFFAAQDGYNAIIEADITSTKVRNGKHQTTIWRGTGTPAQVDSVKLEKHNDRHNQR
ncbi:MAG TPA: hypothetical protein DCS07_03505 [Bdellovibrionales bacterium]|nr:MAG: hypothetical protein A2Z97_11100 [Bdellovibrionales bacterium GWB1_52_6]OFZ02550.1 MAG: hypothetical protein A2X97_07780 [Bdellovibrionales bacterium GWA1_52_35]HAR41684.1 hypothetical protein [Bdellovibrionales bacterium]HCM41399.1 hypothetical protein [Bdellovibrionales bacterium]